MQHKRDFWRGTTILLRPIEQRDVDEALTSTDPLDSEARRNLSRIPFPINRERERAWREAQMKREPSDDTFYFLIESLDGQHVGSINTFDCNPHVGAFKYGIAIFPPYQGRGYAREAITIVLRYYFRELRYQKCTVIVASFNDSSLRLHQRYGFLLEGRVRCMRYTNGRYYDDIYFGLTRAEFDQLDPPVELDDHAPGLVGEESA